GGAVDPAVRTFEPARALLMEIPIPEERAPVDEVVPHVMDRTLHLALRLGPIGPARSGGETPVSRKALKFLVADELTAQEPEILRDHRLHLIEEQLPGHAAEKGERLFETAEQGA